MQFFFTMLVHSLIFSELSHDSLSELHILCSCEDPTGNVHIPSKSAWTGVLAPLPVSASCWCVPWRPQMMAPMFGFLETILESRSEFWAPGFGLPQPLMLQVLRNWTSISVVLQIKILHYSANRMYIKFGLK